MTTASETTVLPIPNFPRTPSPKDGAALFARLTSELADHPPALLLTYGGYGLGRAILDLAHRFQIPAVFWLCNLDYSQADLFSRANAIVVHSQFVQSHYQKSLGLACTVIPPPIDPQRVVSPSPDRKYITFVNPQPAKGAAIFVAIAHELFQCRPDLPLLVVEGRAKVDTLISIGLQPSRANVRVMHATHDPRDFYGVSRLLLMPSLWDEPYGMIAPEAMMNGIPVIAHRRGGLAEAMHKVGVLIDPPEGLDWNHTPPVELINRWVQAILRFSDDPDFEQAQREQAFRAVSASMPEQVIDQYESFFQSLARRQEQPSIHFARANQSFMLSGRSVQPTHPLPRPTLPAILPPPRPHGAIVQLCV